MLLLFRYVFVFEEKGYGQTCRVSVVWWCGRHRQQCGRRHTPMDSFVTKMMTRMMRMMIVAIMRVVLMVTIMMMMKKMAPGGVLTQTL